MFESLDYGWWWKLSNELRLIVTTGSVGLKSKVKPPIVVWGYDGAPRGPRVLIWGPW